jgi:hypothetical protein
MDLSSQIIQEIHDPVTGRVNALLFAEYLGLSVPEIARVLRCSITTLHNNPTALKSPRKQHLTDLYIIVVLLKNKLGENFRMWLNTPNEQIGYYQNDCYFTIRTPIELLCFGGEDKFEKLITLIQGRPSKRINFEWLENLSEDYLKEFIVELVYATNYQDSDLVDEWREVAIELQE